jgi:hypothetical protein
MTNTGKVNTTESCLTCGENREHGEELKTANVDISALLASRNIHAGALKFLPSSSGAFMTQEAAS